MYKIPQEIINEKTKLVLSYENNTLKIYIFGVLKKIVFKNSKKGINQILNNIQL